MVLYGGGDVDYLLLISPSVSLNNCFGYDILHALEFLLLWSVFHTKTKDISIYTHVCMCVPVYVCVCIYLFIHTNTHTHTHTHIYIYSVKVMDWLNMSPDLNPREHLWGILKRQVEVLKVSNIRQLRDVVM